MAAGTTPNVVEDRTLRVERVAASTMPGKPGEADRRSAGHRRLRGSADADGNAEATPGGAWTLAGRDVPHLSPGPTEAAPRVQRFEAALDTAGPMSAARIAVEKINGPLLLISATGDTIWPSFRMSVGIESTLRDARFPFEVRHASYRTGHGFGQEIAPRIKHAIVDHFVETLRRTARIGTATRDVRRTRT